MPLLLANHWPALAVIAAFAPWVVLAVVLYWRGRSEPGQTARKLQRFFA